MLFQGPLSGADNLQQYLSRAVLPPMTNGPSAPPMPPPGHKAHRNHIAVGPASHRSRFTKILAGKGITFDKAVMKFAESLPCKNLNQPNFDQETGFAFTIPAKGFNIGQHSGIRYPSSVQDVIMWLTTFPLQTMTRAMHVAFPESRNWDMMHHAASDGMDASFWNTLVWRKLPSPPDPEKLWVHTADPFHNCSVVFVVQPPWIMTPQDFKSFVNCKSIPAYSKRRDGHRPFKSGERVWAKLWDTCVRMKCHYWVLSSYGGWVFGAFSEAYTAGRAMGYKLHDAEGPTVMECLVYHIACSMGIVPAKLPQYQETIWDLAQEIPVPAWHPPEDPEFSDSGSEWDGMDEEPGISAGVSAAGSAMLSDWGDDVTVVTAPAAKINWWHQRAENDPPPHERTPSPAFSETALSTAGIYAAADRIDEEMPRVRVLTRPGAPLAEFGGVLTTIVEQGPVDWHV